MKLVLLFSVLASLALGLDCNAKTYCSQFSSCEEAMRYLRECGRAQEGGTSTPTATATATACRAKNSFAVITVINLADFLVRAMKRAKFQI